MHGWRAIALIALSQGCARHAEAPLPSRRDLVVCADSRGYAGLPPEVDLVLKRGALRLGPGLSKPHLVAGTVRTTDATLLPHVTVNDRGVAVVQDFLPADATANTEWRFVLGEMPMRLSLDVVGSEDQHVDLGARPIVAARLYNEGGHLDLDWSAPNPMRAQDLEVWSIGYLGARHLLRSGAKRIAVKSVGFADIDLGDRVDGDVRIDVEASTGTLAITVPLGANARAMLEASPSLHVDAEGWTHDAQGGYTLGSPGTPPTVTIAARSSTGAIQLRIRRDVAATGAAAPGLEQHGVEETACRGARRD